MIQLVRYFGWVYVGVVAVDDEFGRNDLIQFLNEGPRNGICIAFNALWQEELGIKNLESVGEKYFVSSDADICRMFPKWEN